MLNRGKNGGIKSETKSEKNHIVWIFRCKFLPQKLRIKADSPKSVWRKDIGGKKDKEKNKTANERGREGKRQIKRERVTGTMQYFRCERPEPACILVNGL